MAVSGGWTKYTWLFSHLDIFEQYTEECVSVLWSVLSIWPLVCFLSVLWDCILNGFIEHLQFGIAETLWCIKNKPYDFAKTLCSFNFYSSFFFWDVPPLFSKSPQTTRTKSAETAGKMGKCRPVIQPAFVSSAPETSSRYLHVLCALKGEVSLLMVLCRFIKNCPECLCLKGSPVPRWSFKVPQHCTSPCCLHYELNSISKPLAHILYHFDLDWIMYENLFSFFTPNKPLIQFCIHSGFL